MEEWYTSHETLVSVAEQALEDGELWSGREMLDFFEKPWHYPEFHQAWVRVQEKALEEAQARRG